jgi:hypothetical protein
VRAAGILCAGHDRQGQFGGREHYAHNATLSAGSRSIPHSREVVCLFLSKVFAVVPIAVEPWPE